MRILTAALFLAVSAASIAPASADRLKCNYLPRDKWISIETVIAKAEAMGYRVRSTEADDGCWEVKAVDRNGAKVKMLFDPATGEPVRGR
ncbi:hypothetical protein AFEL58S_00648 [Afipia felis]